MPGFPAPTIRTVSPTIESTGEATQEGRTAVDVAVGDGDGVEVSVGVDVGAAVGVGVTVGISVAVAVWVGVTLGVLVGVGTCVDVAVGVAVGGGCGATTTYDANRATISSPFRSMPLHPMY